jgi:hypothetical protein
VEEEVLLLEQQQLEMMGALVFVLHQEAEVQLPAEGELAVMEHLITMEMLQHKLVEEAEEEVLGVVALM